MAVMSCNLNMGAFRHAPAHVHVRGMDRHVVFLGRISHRGLGVGVHLISRKLFKESLEGQR